MLVRALGWVLRFAVEAEEAEGCMANEGAAITASVSRADIQALAGFDTPTIANALEVLKVPDVQWTGPSIRSLTPMATPVVGVAVTATMSEQRGGQYEHLEAWVNYCEEIERNDGPVIAVFHDDSKHPGREAMIGEGMSRAVRAVGAVGLICDGCIRDLESLRQLEFPVMGAGLTAHRGRIRFHRYQVPVEVAGMAVVPGDLIHADVNGAVVIPKELAAQVVDAARAVVSKESKLFEMFSDPTYSVKQLRLWYQPAIESARR